MSESSSRAAAREATPAAETTEAPPAPATAAPPAATPSLTHDPEGQPEQPAASDDEEQDQDRDEPYGGDGADPAIILVDGLRHRVLGIGQRDAELGCKCLGDEVDTDRQCLPVVFGGERRQHGVADSSHARID